MIKFSLLWAVWEIVKVFIGAERYYSIAKSRTEDTRGERGFLALISLLYMAWAIWLTFHNPTAAMIMWGLTLVNFGVYYRTRKYWNVYSIFDGIISAGVLVAIYLGKI